MAKMMRAVDIKNGAGKADALFINPNTPRPQPQPHEALVKIRCFGLNRMDILQRQGNYPVPPQAPKTLGVEFSGTISAFGSDTGLHETFKVGDEVFGLAYGGAYAEYIAIDTRMLIHKPRELSWEKAAGIPETWMTATQAMYMNADFGEGKTILWHAAASSVSIAGIQLSKRHGAKAIYGTAGSQEKVDFVTRELGATAAFNYREQAFDEEVLKATDKRGVDIIVDFIGGSYFGKNVNCLAKDGILVCLGMLGGGQVSGGCNIAPFVYKRLTVKGSSLRSRDVDYQEKLRNKLAEEALPGILDGSLQVPIEKAFDWSEIVQAHELMESNKTKGKIICRVT